MAAQHEFKKLVWYGLLVSSVLVLLTVSAAAYGLVVHNPDLPKAAEQLLRALLRVLLVAFVGALVLAINDAVAKLDVDRVTAFLLEVGAGLAAGVVTCAVYAVALSDPSSFELAKLLAQWLTGLVPVGILTLLLFDLGRRLSKTLETEGPPRFERNWGTLGNGAQGWRLSLSLTYLLMFLSVGGLFGYALQSLLNNIEQPVVAVGDGVTKGGGDAKGGEAKGGEAKGGEAKGGEAKGGEAKGGEAKGGEAKGGEAKGGEAKGGEAKGGEAKSGEAKSGEAKSGEAKSGEAKGGEAKGGEAKGGEAKGGETKRGAAKGGEAKKSEAQ